MPVVVAKPGVITDAAAGQGGPTVPTSLVLPKITVTQVAAALLHTVVNGCDADTLANDHLAAIGSKALGQQVL